MGGGQGYTLTVHINQVERPGQDLERQTILFLDETARAMEGKTFIIMPGHKSVEVKEQGMKDKEWQF